MKQIYSAILIPLLLSSFSWAQVTESWTLQHCVEYAMENNLSIYQGLQNIDLSYINHEQNKAAFYPTVNGSASHARSFGKSFNVVSNESQNLAVQSNSFNLSAGILLFSGFSRLNNLKRSDVELEISRLDAREINNSIVLGIVNAYLNILLAEESLKTNELQSILTNQQISQTQKLIAAGVVAPGAIYTLEAQKASDELSLVNTANTIDLAYVTLAQLMNEDPTKKMRVTKPQISLPSMFEIENINVEEIIQKAYASQPRIQSNDLRIESAEIGKEIAKASYFPTVSFGGSIGTQYSNAVIGSFVPVNNNPLTVEVESTRFFNQLSDNLGENIGFSLNVPILNGFQARYNEQRAQIAINTAKTNAQLAKDNLSKEIYQAVTNVKASLKSYKAIEANVAALKKSFEFARKKHELGLLNTLDLNTEKNNLARAEIELLRAKYTLIFNMKTLDYYQGIPITL